MITKSFIKQKRFNSFFKFIQTLNHSNFMRKSVSPKSKIDVLHLWEFNTQHRRVAPRPLPVTTESVCISLRVLRGHEGRFFSDCFGRLYAPHFRHSVISLLAIFMVYGSLLTEKRSCKTWAADFFHCKL